VIDSSKSEKFRSSESESQNITKNNYTFNLCTNDMTAR
jgi:hypothetical protein